jgi:hypothetical protein
MLLWLDKLLTEQFVWDFIDIYLMYIPIRRIVINLWLFFFFLLFEKNKKGTLYVYEKIACSSFAGIVGCLIGNPADVALVRM